MGLEKGLRRDQQLMLRLCDGRNMGEMVAG